MRAPAPLLHHLKLSILRFWTHKHTYRSHLSLLSLSTSLFRPLSFSLCSVLFFFSSFIVVIIVFYLIKSQRFVANVHFMWMSCSISVWAGYYGSHILEFIESVSGREPEYVKENGTSARKRPKEPKTEPKTNIKYWNSIVLRSLALRLCVCVHMELYYFLVSHSVHHLSCCCVVWMFCFYCIFSSSNECIPIEMS